MPPLFTTNDDRAGNGTVPARSSQSKGYPVLGKGFLLFASNVLPS
jgi:hypothetical protein